MKIIEIIKSSLRFFQNQEAFENVKEFAQHEREGAEYGLKNADTKKGGNKLIMSSDTESEEEKSISDTEQSVQNKKTGSSIGVNSPALRAQFSKRVEQAKKKSIFEKMRQDEVKAIVKAKKQALYRLFKQCYNILTLFCKGNIKHKNILLNHIHLFTQFNEIDVGQAELITEIFVSNNKAKRKICLDLMTHYTNIISNEGRQTRFLGFFKAVLHQDEGDGIGAERINFFLDTFLPFFVPTEDSKSLKLLFSYINKETG